MKTALFIDLDNITKCMNYVHLNRRLNLEKYVSFINPEVCFAYVAAEYAYEFNDLDVILRTKPMRYVHNQPRISFDVEIAIDAVLCEADHYVFGTSDQDLIPLIRYLRSAGKDVTVFSCGMGNELINAATKIKMITEDFCHPIKQRNYRDGEWVELCS